MVLKYPWVLAMKRIVSKMDEGDDIPIRNNINRNNNQIYCSTWNSGSHFNYALIGQLWRHEEEKCIPYEVSEDSKSEESVEAKLKTHKTNTGAQELNNAEQKRDNFVNHNMISSIEEIFNACENSLIEQKVRLQRIDNGETNNKNYFAIANNTSNDSENSSNDLRFDDYVDEAMKYERDYYEKSGADFRFDLIYSCRNKYLVSTNEESLAYKASRESSDCSISNSNEDYPPNTPRNTNRIPTPIPQQNIRTLYAPMQNLLTTTMPVVTELREQYTSKNHNDEKKTSKRDVLQNTWIENETDSNVFTQDMTEMEIIEEQMRARKNYAKWKAMAQRVKRRKLKRKMDLFTYESHSNENHLINKQNELDDPIAVFERKLINSADKQPEMKKKKEGNNIEISNKILELNNNSTRKENCISLPIFYETTFEGQLDENVSNNEDIKQETHNNVLFKNDNYLTSSQSLEYLNVKIISESSKASDDKGAIENISWWKKLITCFKCCNISS